LRLGERYVANILYRIKVFFSIETLVLAGLIWLSSIIIDAFDLWPPLGLRWTQPNLHMLYQIGIILFLFTLVTIVYGTGEFIRRKFNFKSLLFFDTKNIEIQQAIISIIRDNSAVTTGYICDTIGIDIFHTEAYIRALKKSGSIRSEGWGKNRRWFVLEK